MTSHTIHDRPRTVACSFATADACRHHIERHDIERHHIERHDVSADLDRSGAAGATVAPGETPAYRTIVTGNGTTWLRAPKFATPRHFQRWRSAT